MRKVTTKVDVFSFGTVVMELLTRRRPTALDMEDGTAINLHQLAHKALTNGSDGILKIVDPALVSHVSEKQMEILKSLIKLAQSCTSVDPTDRPDMDEVVAVLVKIKG